MSHNTFIVGRKIRFFDNLRQYSTILSVIFVLSTGASCDHGGDGDGGTAGETAASTSSGTGNGEACELVPEPGPALLDFGKCVVMGSERSIGACGNTGIHRVCDEAFLTWCNSQNGDVVACEEREVFSAQSVVPCGTGPNAIACGLPFTSGCDALDGDLICYDDGCFLGGCAINVATERLCCEACVKNPDGTSLCLNCKLASGTDPLGSCTLDELVYKPCDDPVCTGKPDGGNTCTCEN